MIAPAHRLALLVMLTCAAIILAAANPATVSVNDAAIGQTGFTPNLSDYRFFNDLKRETPAARVTPYTLITPLFSDYAEKHRFLYLPDGQVAKYTTEGVLDLPVGSALIKTFGYSHEGGFDPIETRVLLRRKAGWEAVSYAWNADRSDAVLKRGGGRVAVDFTDPSGTKRSISYAIPNQNQCKECHALAGRITPIGPRVRNLNDGTQLQAWRDHDMLDRLPADAPAVARWDDVKAPIADRARAYLDVNCAHCHNPVGAASNSGLYLEWTRQQGQALGIGKHPVAAGRGSGGRDVAIDPGHPDRSILPYRMASTDPGIAMPELGRATVDAEGLALIDSWIAAMPKPDEN